MNLSSKWTTFSLALVIAVATTVSSTAQHYASGQNIAPIFEGWELNPDGSFSLNFGYLNRNYETALNVPLGPDNNIEPGGPDQGQPTHFYTRRQRYTFKVRVPKDWGKKDLVWTLTVNGKTEKAYGSLLGVEMIDRAAIVKNRTGAVMEEKGNKPPAIKAEGPSRRTVSQGERVTLVAYAIDDGIPKPTPARESRPPGRMNALGLRVGWIQYRGPGDVKIDPFLAPGADHFPPYVPPPLSPDGKVVTTAVFDTPGTYVLRGIADDGFLYDFVDVTIEVKPKPSPGTAR